VYTGERFSRTGRPLAAPLAIGESAGTSALRPYVAPPQPVHNPGSPTRSTSSPAARCCARPNGSKQVYGRVVLDLRNGKIWAFPTFTQDPHPVNAVNSTPPTSHPFLLGKFALADTDN